MPVTIKTANMKYKNSENKYVDINTFAETSTAKKLAAIEAKGAEQILSITTKGEETLESIPNDYISLANQVNNIQNSIATSFSTSVTYSIGDYVTYNGNYYKFTSVHNPGTWNSGHVSQINISNELCDEIDNCAKNLGTISGGSDLNNYIVDTGYYHLTQNQSYTNCPALNSHRRLLLVLKRSDAIIYQILFDITNGEIYTRLCYLSGANWIYNNWGSGFSTYPMIVEGDDFNNFIDHNGFTILKRTIDITNAPTGFDKSHYHALLVYKQVNAYGNGYTQILFDFDSGIIYIRMFKYTTWSSWMTIGSNDFAHLSIIETNTDLNNINESGYSLLRANGTFANLPDSVLPNHRAYFAMYQTSARYGIQFLFDTITGEIYIRRKEDNVWGAWHGLIGDKSQDIVLLNNPGETVAKLNQLKHRGTLGISIRGSQVLPTPLTLLHFSDLHRNDTALKRILQYKKTYQSYINDIIHTGDIQNNITQDLSTIYNISGMGSILNVVGNHETWDGQDGAEHWNVLDEQETRDRYFDHVSTVSEPWEVSASTDWDVQFPDSEKCYYYKDYALGAKTQAGDDDYTKDVRLIVLDSQHDTVAQRQWFEDTLADASGRQILVACHVPEKLGTDMSYINSSFTNPLFDHVTSTNPFPSYINDAYVTILNNFILDGGTVIAWLCGHYHTDILGTVGDVLNIAVTTAGAINTSKDSRNPVSTLTKSYDAFNIMGIDTYLGLLKVMRVGMNYNGAMQHVDTFCWDYINHTIIYTS